MKCRAVLLVFAFSFLTGCTTADKDYIRDHVAAGQQQARSARTPAADTIQAAKEPLPGH